MRSRSPPEYLLDGAETMSWLFDRLTDLAVADHLTIVIDSLPCSDDNRSTDDELELMLCRARQLPGTSVWNGKRPPVPVCVDESAGAHFVASGMPSGPSLFATLGEHDLGVSVGAVALGANLKVNAVADLASLLDSLVTLRSYAQRTAV